MKFLFRKDMWARTGAVYLAAAVFFSAIPMQAFAAPTVDIKANGQDGTVEVVNGDTWDFAWTSSPEATACTIAVSGFEEPLSGLDPNGSDGPIGQDHPWYPSVGNSVTLTLNCTDGADSQTDSVTIKIIEPTGPVSADIKANGSDGPVTINNGDSWNYSWSSANATACTLISPTGTTGLTEVNGTDGPIDSTHPWYPTATTSTTLTLNCTDGADSSSDSVTISLVTAPEVVTADIKANGSDGPVTINSGDSWNYSWTSSNATACVITSPTGPTGSLEAVGSDGPIGPDHPWYPTVGSSTVLTLDCTNGVDSASDSVEIRLQTTGGGVTADIKANGSDGPVVIANGTPWNYNWTSTGATSCLITINANGTTTSITGLPEQGSDGPINPSHPFYPAVGSSTILILDCTNGTDSASDSVEIRVTEVTSCPVPSITSSLTASVTRGNEFTYTITHALPLGATTTGVTINATNLPSWLSFNATTSVLSGTPTENGTYSVTLTATNNCGTDTKILVITVSGGGGGGGGGRRNRSSSSTPTPQVLGETTANFCPFLTSYMRMGQANDTMEVIRLQAFLKAVEKFDYVEVNGVFDAATDLAVREFQLRYASEVLYPWGISQPTGYVYKLTQAKINQILCGGDMPHVQKPVKPAPKVLGKEAMGYKEGAGTSTVATLPLIGQDVDKGQIVEAEVDGYPESVAAAVFTWPSNGSELMTCLYELLIILVVLYILGNVLESVLYKDNTENVLKKRFYAKWTLITAGLAVAWAGAYYMQEWCLLLPLLVAFIASLIWTLSRPKHTTLETSAKSWYSAGSAKAKTFIKRKEGDKANTQAIMVTEKTEEKK